MTIEEIINEIIKVEGGYVNDLKDSGGATNYGITIAVARANGYTGDMKDLPIEKAYQIYYDDYVVKPGFDKVLALSPAIAAELVDTGVNMGPAVASKFLQQCLNAFNDESRDYPDVVVDGKLGKASISALEAFLKRRKGEGKGKGENVMLKALNALQGARYIMLAETSPKNERFLFGWFANRL